MPTITLDDGAFKRAVASIKRWANGDIEGDLDTGVDKLVKKYKTQIKDGKTGDNSSMKSIKNVTFVMPIRIASDRTLRKEVNGSSKPLVARGDAVRSIGKQKTSIGYEIGPQTQHGKRVFTDNAYPRANSRQKVTKAVRDPLVVSDVQLDIIEAEIMKGLDKAIRG